MLSRFAKASIALNRRAITAPIITSKRFFAEETPLTETVRHFLDPADFVEMLSKNDIDFYTGVPDSLLKDVCAYIQVCFAWPSISES